MSCDYDYNYDYEARPLPSDADAPVSALSEASPVSVLSEEEEAILADMEERQRFHDEHMLLPDGTVDMTIYHWITSRKLLCKDLPPLRYLVEGLLPQGLAILASPPKYGKSWLALDLCLALSEGRPFLGRKTEQCDTLYLALEDSENRLQKRIYDLLGAALPPENFYCGVLAGTISDRLPHQLEMFLHGHPNVGLVVIDTFQKVRDGSKAGADVYARDYKDVGALKELADRHGICVLLLHHLRKAGDSSDPFARISGTNGIFGAADTAFVMTRTERADDITLLSSTGRDVLAEDFEMQFDKAACRWQLLENRAARSAEERYRADPVVQTALRLVRDNPSGWQGTASELTGWVRETTGVEITAQSLSSRMRSVRDDLLRYNNVVYTPPTAAKNGRRVHSLYPAASKCS